MTLTSNFLIEGNINTALYRHYHVHNAEQYIIDDNLYIYIIFWLSGQ